MKYPVHFRKRIAVITAAAAAIVVAMGLLESSRSHGQVTNANGPQESGTNPSKSFSETALDLSASQLNSVKIESGEELLVSG